MTLASRRLLGLRDSGGDGLKGFAWNGECGCRLIFLFPPVLLKETKSRFNSWHLLFEDSTAPIFCGRQLSFCQFICGHQPYLCGHILYAALAVQSIQKVGWWVGPSWLIELQSLPKLRLWYRKDKALKHSVSFGTRHFLMGGRDPFYGSTRNPQST